MALTGQEQLYISSGGNGQVTISLAELAAYLSTAGVTVTWDDVQDKPPMLPEAAITAIGTLDAESTAADIVAALQAT